MPRAVLDTNVIVFRSLSEHGPPDWIVDLVAAGELAADCDTRILAEYRDVQTRSRLNLNVTRFQLLLDIVQHTGIPITPMPWQVPLPDPDDEPFIACAKMALAPLVTGNLRHYPEQLRIEVIEVIVLSLRQFLDKLRA